MGTTHKKTKTAHLKLLSGESDEPSRIDLKGTKVEIGRAVSNDVMINSAHVSRKHVVFMYEHDKWMVKDLSTNGVSINSRKLPKDQFVPLHNADKIALVPTGALQYQFQYLIPTNCSEQRLPGNIEASVNRNVPCGVQNNVENIPAQNVLEREQRSPLKSDSRIPEFKSLWKRPHNSVEYDSSDSDEPKNSKKLRVINDLDSSEFSDSDDGSIPKKPKAYMIPLANIKLSPLLGSSQTEVATSNSDSVVEKDESGSESTKTDTKRRSREQITSLKRKIQKLQGENTFLNKKCDRLESEKESLEKNSQSEKQNIYSSIMNCFGTEFSCSICTEVFIDPVVVNCGHTFCSFCINQWLKEKSVCAICRKQVSHQSRHVEVNNLLVSVWDKMPQAMQFKRQNDMRDREEAVRVAQARARAEANRPRPTATLGRGGAFIPEENFVSFLLSRHFFAQVVDREREHRPVSVSLRASRLVNNGRLSPPTLQLQTTVTPRRSTTPPRPTTPPRRRSARIQVRSQIN